MKVMENARDLDEFDPDQIDLTNTNPENLKNLCMSAMALCGSFRMILFQIPLPHWQRAAYEMRGRAEKEQTEASDMAAKIMWEVVLFMQAMHKLYGEATGNDRLKGEMTAMGFPEFGGSDFFKDED